MRKKRTSAIDSKATAIFPSTFETSVLTPIPNASANQSCLGVITSKSLYQGGRELSLPIYVQILKEIKKSTLPITFEQWIG